ncbi:unnamed protein product [Prorocentrum cordatum]|uniref:SET domain-containing protein n=1 Tax=Prorocentrum cordatum TaxID=2364126 RepID=A0ABN9RE45_9DINO|nr:unnamed protein product [Polarella glacialis]
MADGPRAAPRRRRRPSSWPRRRPSAAPRPPCGPQAWRRRATCCATRPELCRAWTDPPLAALGASRLHGAGVFAARDIAAGEVVEMVPSLPVSYAEICNTPLRDYVFGSDFEPGADDAWQGAVFLPLSLGGAYNHGARPNVYPQRFLDQPFVQADLRVNVHRRLCSVFLWHTHLRRRGRPWRRSLPEPSCC